MSDNDNVAAAEDESAVSGEPELEQLRAEVAELKEKHLRALAEIENTRRRAERDRLDASQYAVTRFARDMLAVSDNLQRALDHLPTEVRADAAPALKAVLEGVEATERQLSATLEQHGVKRIETKDAKFDPHLHQAIAEVPADGRPAGRIVDVVQTGYVISDRLLRPAMVTVARGESNPASNDSSRSPEDSRQ